MNRNNAVLWGLDLTLECDSLFILISHLPLLKFFRVDLPVLSIKILAWRGGNFVGGRVEKRDRGKGSVIIIMNSGTKGMRGSRFSARSRETKSLSRRHSAWKKESLVFGSEYFKLAREEKGGVCLFRYSQTEVIQGLTTPLVHYLVAVGDSHRGMSSVGIHSIALRFWNWCDWARRLSWG